MARAESASAAPVSLDCEQADCRKRLGVPQSAAAEDRVDFFLSPVFINTWVSTGVAFSRGSRKGSELLHQ